MWVEFDHKRIISTQDGTYKNQGEERMSNKAEVTKREWIGITSDDIMDIWTKALEQPEFEQVEEVADLVEQILKERNE